VQDNGGRKPRRILQTDAGEMDLLKVVEWVKHQRLENALQVNEPTGQAKLRKVRTSHHANRHCHLEAGYPGGER
jgi:hypothetical protein